MGKCVVCGKDSKSECCSGACRAKKSRRTVERTEAVRTVDAHAAHGVIIDACGTEHKAVEQSTASAQGVPVGVGRVTSPFRDDTGKEPIDFYKRGKDIQYKTAAELGEHELNRVSLPGDPDYDGVCLDAKCDDHRIKAETKPNQPKAFRQGGMMADYGAR